jgi:hypothetical protein
MQKNYLIDHRLLFLFGYFFYLFVPYLVGSNQFFEGFPGIDLYFEWFSRIPEQQLQTYLWITLAWLPAFFAGHFTFRLLQPTNRPLHKFPATPISLSVPLVGVLLIFVLIIFTFLARGSLFGGYSNYDVGARGKMSTLLVVFNYFLLYVLLSDQRLPLLIVGGTLITAFILLTMGGRMYVFQTFVIILVYKTSFSNKRWGIFQIAIFSLAALCIGAVFGLWRMGASLNLQAAMYSFFAEPTFTWFSTTTFLSANEIHYFNWPANYISSFVNLIPNTIISVKPYLVSLESMVKDYSNPLGADSVWSTFVINFGSIGSILFIFVTGFMLNALRYASRTSRFWAVYYIMVCGLLPFQFFRDGFYILNKQLFFNFLLLPAAVLMTIKTLLYLQQKWLLSRTSLAE